MPSPEKHPLHLKNPDLQASPEVEAAVRKHERLGGEKVPNNPSERIEAYLDRLEKIFLNSDEQVRERNLEMLRPQIYDQLIIKKENFPDSYFELQKRVARERGQAVEEIPESVREQMIDVVIEDQKQSLDAIIDYLSSNDATYPPWFKYYAWTQLTKLSQFDKERGEFKKRTASTVAPFPNLHYGPLAAIADLYERVKDNSKDSEARREFDKKFPTLYAELIAKSLAETVENQEEIQGTWVKYNQGDAAAAETLFQSLKGRGTGWCTADGRTTAEQQIKSGDFYVYYTNNASGEPTQPRLAIRMEGKDRIGEVRGILPRQGVEPLLQETLDEKLTQFGSEADAYRKKSEDMRKLTALEKKHEAGQEFTKDDVTFLYELDTKIEGFGYGRDPRIGELRSKRKIEEDVAIIFECTKEQVVLNSNEINENTKVYVGEWNPIILQTVKKYPNIEHLYESFPEKKIFLYTLETDPTIQAPAEAQERLKAQDIYLDNFGKDILEQTEFSLEAKTYKLAVFTVAQLGFEQKASIAEIFAKAQELGLELCPAEVGPQLRLAYKERDRMYIAMYPITDRGGYPCVFDLGADEDRLGLGGPVAEPVLGWRSDDRFCFSYPPATPKRSDGGKANISLPLDF